MERKSLDTFRNALRGNRRPSAVVSQFRGVLGASELDEAVALLLDSPKWRAGLPSPFPTSIGQVKAAPHFSMVGLKRELQWGRAYLRLFSSRLTTFVELRDAFHTTLLRGQFVDGRAVLQRLEDELGQSLWLYKSKILLSQLAEGLDAQRDLTQRLKSQSAANHVVAYVAHFVSVRSEPSVRGATYIQRIQDELYNGKLSPDFAAYLHYHLSPIVPLTEETAEFLLLHESSGAVIDYFSAMVDSVSAIACRAPEVRQYAVRIAESLSRSIPDRRLRFVADLHGDRSRAPEWSQGAVEGAIDVLRGRYESAGRTARIEIDANPQNSEAIDVLARAIAERSDPGTYETPVLQIAKATANALRRGPGLEDALDELAKWANQLPGSNLPQHLSRAIAAAGTGIDKAYDRLWWMDWALSSPGLFPERIFELHRDEDQELYASKLRAVLPPGDASEFVEAITSGIITEQVGSLLTSEGRLFIAAQLAAQRGLHTETIETAAQLTASSSPVFRAGAVHLLSGALLAIRDLDRLVKVLVGTILDDNSTVALVPLRDAVESFTVTDRKALSRLIQLPLLYELYSRYVASTFDDMRGALCWSFCKAAGVERPSQLRDIKDRFHQGELIHFLQFVCTENVLATSQIFSSTRAVAEERLLLCRILAELNPKAADKYETETSDILRRVSLKRRMQVIERSKVYVDTIRLRKSIPEKARQAFERYRGFLKLGNSIHETYIVQEVISSMKDAKGGALQVLVLPNEMREAFETAVDAVRDEYVSSTEYGLDGYLSVNIRHGTLAGQLRSPLEAAHLVMRQLPESVRYRENDHWLGRVGPMTDRERARLSEQFETLSREFDGVIDEVTGQWLRLAKENNSTAMFNFRLVPAQYRSIVQRVSDTTTFEDFVDAVLEQLSSSLDAILAVIRRRLTGELTDQSLALLDRLQTSSEALLGGDRSEGLTVAISSARTELQRVISRVAEWFRLAKGVLAEPFAIEDAVNLCVETVRGYEKEADIKVHVDHPGKYVFPGGSLASLYYVFINALENVVKHSRLEPSSADIRVQHDSMGLSIQISNPIHPQVAKQLSASLQTRRVALAADASGSQISREGGSGFHKMRALLQRDFGAGASLSVEAIGDRFVLSFCLPQGSYEHSAT